MIYFGTKEKFQYVKCMLSELPAASVGWSNVLQFQNGGADVVRTFGSHRVFDASWSGNAEQVGVFKDYANGLYGNGLLYFTLPHAEHSNLFAPHWAAPRLIEVEEYGWPEIYDTAATFSNTSSNSYSQPPRSATYTTAASVPERRFTIPIPSDKTLHLGWSGSKTGSGAVYYRGLNADGTYDSAVALTALSPTASTRMNATIAGSTCVAAEIYLYGSGTVTIASLQAQLWNTGVSPTLTGSFKPGRGWTGMKFAEGVQESITMDTDGDKQVMSMNATLVEVEAWLPIGGS